MGTDQLDYLTNSSHLSQMDTNNTTQGDDDITKVDADGNTELHDTVLDKKVEQLKELLEKRRIDVNKKNKKGETPLHLAVYNGHSNCVKLLLSMPGIAVNIPDAKGLTPVHVSVQEGEIKSL